MFTYIRKKRNCLLARVFSLVINVAFIFNLVILPSKVAAQGGLNLPAVGTMVTTSSKYAPPLMAGITLYPDNPLKFDFMITTGDDDLEGQAFQKESQKLINYFLATLTVPDDEMWVNLSPYEENRIIAEGLAKTEMGRDMLIQDYTLKQLTASLMYPEEELGEKFWKRIYAKSRTGFGATDIPTDTFNKVWIVPEEAVIYVNGLNVFISKSHLKVMLEEDYLALESNQGATNHGLGEMTKDDIVEMNQDAEALIREVILPEIEREVNEGKNFANLRQIYHSMILASWYKRNLKESVLGKVYMDMNRVEGIDLEDKQIKEKIYQQYIEAYKVGVYDYIKEDYDALTKEFVPRKYFSGGLTRQENIVEGDLAMTSEIAKAQRGERIIRRVQVEASLLGSDVSHVDKATLALTNALKRGYEELESLSLVVPDTKVEDQYIPSMIKVDERGRAIGVIQEGDAVISFNFRRDRTNQMTQALASGKSFEHFNTEDLDLTITTMMEDEHGLLIGDDYVAFPPIPVPNNIGEYLSGLGKKQYRTAETEKYRHATRFLNGGAGTEPYEGETRKLIASPKDVPTYDAKPQMSAYEVTDSLVERIEQDNDDFYFVNYANPDMVGHTGNFIATVEAIRHVNDNVQRVVEMAKAKGLNIIITADHGNADEMLDKKGNVQTKHSKNPVPFIVIPSNTAKQTAVPTLAEDGGLADVMPTLLHMSNIPLAPEMTGRNLLSGYEFDGEQKSILIVLDGFGINPDPNAKGDAIREASRRGLTPYLDQLFANELNTTIQASGKHVGLPEGTMGNSEVGHAILGAGRIIDDQPQVRVNNAIERDTNEDFPDPKGDGTFFTNKALLRAIHAARDKGTALHLIGLVSDGRIHSKMDHIYKLLEMAKREGVEEVYIHAELDGRDTPPQSAEEYLAALQSKIEEIGVGEVVSMIGRESGAMDRDWKWDRTKVAYDLYVYGEAKMEWNDDEQADEAMVGTPLGGIDFNSENLNLKEEGQTIDIDFSNLPNIQVNNINGVNPVIIGISPISNIPLLLGRAEEEEIQEISQL